MTNVEALLTVESGRVPTGGLIVREAWGLRNWRYDELTRVYVLVVDGEPQLCLQGHDTNARCFPESCLRC